MTRRQKLTTAAVTKRLSHAAAAFVTIVLLAALGSASAEAFQTHNFEASFGPDGTSATSFNEPGAVAVDQSTGSLYVGQPSFGGDIEKFNAAREPDPFMGIDPAVVEGKLIGFGSTPPLPSQIAVNSSTDDVYFTAGSAVRAYQSDGEPADFIAGPGKGTNEIAATEVCGVAVDSAGDIYVTEHSTSVSVFAPSGEPLKSFAVSGVCNIAVDANGTVYLAGAPNPAGSEVSGPVQKFTASNVPPVTGATSYEASGAVDETPSFAVAVNPASNDLLVDEGNQIAEYDEFGARLGSFGASAPGALLSPNDSAGVSVNAATGQVYVAQGFEGQAEVFGPAILLPDVTTGAASEINPTGSATLNGAVNPDGVEVTDCHFDYGTTTAYDQVAPCVETVGSGSGEVSVHADVAGLTAGTTYHFRLQASNSNGPNPGTDATLATPPEPAIDATSVANLTASSGDLDAQVNPGGIEVTDCHFDYGTSIPYEHSEPCEQPVGSGTADVPVSRHITGLSANQTYHWRVVATNAAGTTSGVDHTFIYDTSGEALPDNRAYEMVTPPHKNAALVGDALFGLRPDVSGGGSRVEMSSIQCFAGAEACEAKRGETGSLYLFSRSSSGWMTTPLAPPAASYPESSAWIPNADAGTALYSMPTAPALEDDFYARGTNGTFADVGPATPPADGELGLPWEGRGLASTSDFSHVIFQIEEGVQWPFAEGAPGPYEFSRIADEPPSLVAVSGGAGSTALISRCLSALAARVNSTAPGALSADGQTVYFTAEPCGGGTGSNASRPVKAKEVFARVGAAQTVPLSEPSAFAAAAPYPGCSAEPCIADVNDEANWQNGVFAGASRDGSRAFFTSNQQLEDSATQGSTNLYEAELGDAGEAGQKAIKRLIDVSAGDSSGHGPRVQGVVALSPDGSHVYFVAQGAVTNTPNASGEHALDGAENLYVFDREAGASTGHLAFITRLSAADQHQWETNDSQGPANVTPDGRFLVFESHEQLTPDDTRTNGPIQIYRYDAQEATLERLSIGQHGFNDDGNAGVGDAGIVEAFEGGLRAGPARSNPTMSNDGSYVFFESPIALTSHALNDVQVGSFGGAPIYAENVYEWHEGEVHLISDGRDTNAATLSETCRADSAVCIVGVDESGRNVFFTTADPLVSSDTDTQIDVYDAHICSAAEPCIAEPPAALPPCSGEACHGTPAGTPSQSAAPTTTFNGSGNAVPLQASPAAVSKPLTRKQKLAKALKACHRKHAARRRRSCERTARARYGPAKGKSARHTHPRRGGRA